jgi:RIO kinase 3
MASSEGPLVVPQPTPAPSSTFSTSTSPWGRRCPLPPSPPVANLSDIMSEQLASTLQLKEEERYVEEVLLVDPLVNHTSPSAGASAASAFFVNHTSPESVDTTSDFMIARMLQLQFSKEHDEGLRRIEAKRNGNSKVSISLDNYMMMSKSNSTNNKSTTLDDLDDSSDDDYSDLPPPKCWDSFEAAEKAFPNLGKCGYARGVNNELVTKHDIPMNQRRNACRVMESLPPCIETGDAGSFDMQLSNKVSSLLIVAVINSLTNYLFPTINCRCTISSNHTRKRRRIAVRDCTTRRRSRRPRWRSM